MREGDVIDGHYRLCERVGIGGFGTVYRAEEIRGGGSMVAIKVFTAEPDDEMQLLASLDHPHILRYRTCIEHMGRLCLVTDFADGGDAATLLQAFPDGMPIDHVAPIIQAIAEALAYLHGLMIVHRDIKPSNILFVNGRVRLGDVGLAKALSDAVSQHSGVQTMGYTAPEMFSGQVGFKSDIYALGVTAFELLTGRLPFEGTPAELVMGHLHRQPSIPSGLPRDWQAFLRRCLAKNVDERPSASDIVVDAGTIRLKAQTPLVNEASNEGNGALRVLDEASFNAHLAQEYHDTGVTLKGQGRHKRAAQHFLIAAQHGHADAQYRLYEYFLKGKGVNKDETEAIKWLNEAAEQGHSEAKTEWERRARSQADTVAPQSLAAHSRAPGEAIHAGQPDLTPDAVQDGQIAKHLDECSRLVQDGEALRDGRGIPQDPAGAAKLFLEAAHLGDARGQFNLAKMYLAGQGVPLDPQMGQWLTPPDEQEKTARWDRIAFSWCEKAASQGLAEAEYLLGTLLESGRGVALNIDRAQSWYQKALRSFQTQAKRGEPHALFRLTEMYRYGRGVAKNDAMALNLLVQASEAGLTDADFSLGELYEEGVGVPRNESTAFQYYLRAAKAGLAKAQSSLAWMYRHGQGTARDSVQAVYWYQKAAGHGLPRAGYFLGEMHLHGEGTPQSDLDAAQWFHLAAEQGDPWAQAYTGWMHLHGKGVELNESLAAAWFQKAARQGNAWGQFSLGELYQDGRGVPLDLSRAKYWFDRASENGTTERWYQ